MSTQDAGRKGRAMKRRTRLVLALVLVISLLVVSTPVDVVQFGQYDLRKTSLLKCASARGRPYTSILLSQDSESWVMLADVLLDSGADTSLFPAWVAEELGIDLSQCPQGTSSGVGGTTTTYYAEVYVALVHMGGIETDVDGYILAAGGEPLLIKARVAFTKDEANADTYLLGRRDVFDALTLSFQGDTATVIPASPEAVSPGGTSPAQPPGGVAPLPGGTSLAGMVLIPAGSFRMGDSFGEGSSDERPVHTVYVSAFTMDRYEVTKALWDEVASWAAAHGYDIGPADGDGKAAAHPVHNVTWYDVVKWANARSEREGLEPCYTVGASVYRTEESEPNCNWSVNGYRLPTEAEWEKAARGGAEGRRFPWSDVDTIQHARANYYSRSDYSYDTSPTRGYHPDYDNTPMPYTSPVGSFAPNGYGLYDMAGNVWEWCWDWYGESTYASSPGSDARGPASGSNRVGRGGGWDSGACFCRVANRDYDWPDSEYSNLGFRLVRTAP
jgi:formylglycine-generating enzyme required for sulfatase activity